jgi:hypothetical protein
LVAEFDRNPAYFSMQMAGKLMKAVQYSGYGGGAGALQVNLIEFFKPYKL